MSKSNQRMQRTSPLTRKTLGPSADMTKMALAGSDWRPEGSMGVRVQ